ncbi:hypothetical protein HME9302_02351 [Alteripontixanthobacter maritimus]|uniref:Uncharacterized protein n=1 Tax=Alteripontixanthobacter maritimus TaxID=2161824 RepID=A0A369Q9H5_9SPHN|nr:hypothetical protein [Alteripontixanthobacter maritimus]RDC61132.1 hypothetical protein HME9302_02351 [Alteripontixanthobacter maritimus]
MSSTARRVLVLPLLAASLMTGGCVMSTVADVVTAPIKVAGKAVDLATTSQSESDEKRGRELRERYERLGKLERRYDRKMKECRDGNRRACDEARAAHREIQALIPSLPAQRADDD